MTQLTVLDHVPDGLLDKNARELHRVLDGPTLIELPGRSGAPLFVSGLMHGNEDSGLGAIQRLLRQYHGQALPRPVMLMIGNVAAAQHGMRRLDHQPDYNRVWPGCTSGGDTIEAQIMADVHRRVVAAGAMAAIDIHNNTGRNPHYGVVCVRDPRVLGLASMFAPRAVLFRGLPGTQTASFTGQLPSLTIECGQPGDSANSEAAAGFIERVLEVDELASLAERQTELALFHTLAQVTVKPEISLDDRNGSGWLNLEPRLDQLNFDEVDAGTVIATTDHPMPLAAISEDGTDKASSFFSVESGTLRLSQTAIPAMLTTDSQIIRQDCLCYLMERLAPSN